MNPIAAVVAVVAAYIFGVFLGYFNGKAAAHREHTEENVKRFDEKLRQMADKTEQKQFARHN